jgi:carbonic anhydrase/acetyltransferase-like protein (isoleucine patch superfamily)
MISKKIASLLNLNPFSELYFGRKCGQINKFICRGRIQVSFASDSTLVAPEQVSYIGLPLLGQLTDKHHATIIVLEAGSRLHLNGVTLGKGSVLGLGPKASLMIEDGTYITDGTRIYARNSISIGKKCSLSWNVTVMDDDGHGFALPPYSAPIVIEDEVWVGCNVTILKGVTIGHGSVIASGAVVTRSCPPNSLIGGVPAKIIRANIHWQDHHRRP